MQKRNKIRAGASALAFGAILGLGGFAFAAFTEDTVATATDTQAAQMTPLALQGYPATDYDGSQTAMWPNHPADVVFTVKNNNEVPVTVTNIVNTGVVATGATPSDCAGHIVVNPIVVPGGTLPTVAADGGTAELRLLGVIKLGNSAPNTCQGATFSTQWTVTGANS